MIFFPNRNGRDPARRAAALALMICASFALPVSVNAASWAVDKKRSVVAFDYSENGKIRSGQFRRYELLLDADPARLDQTTARIAIDVVGLSLNDVFREGILMTDPWFRAGAFPEATFELMELVPSDAREDGYDAVGTMTIKGISKSYTVPLTLEIEGDEARASGTFSLAREDFKLRDKITESFVEIGKTIKIRFDFLATARR